MVIAALVTFGVLLLAWCFAPGDAPVTRERTGAFSEEALAEAA